MALLRISLTAALFGVIAAQAGALTLAECTRTTHVSHGGQALHRDLGEGRVMWLDWWSQEGTAETLVLVDCASGDSLRALTAEENMNARLPIDKTDKAERIITEEHRAARVFATLPRIATAMEDAARDITLARLTQESCACAALYAPLRGNKAPFALPAGPVQP